MAIKVALAAALLVALVALAGATTFTTTVTTTSMEENDGSYRQCSRQLQGRQFRACQRYLSPRGGRGPYEEEEDVIEMSTDNQQQQQQHLQECCQQLREVDQQGQCGCEAIRHAVRQVQQGGSRQQTGQSEQIYQRARALPRQCNLRSQQCQFHVVFV